MRASPAIRDGIVRVAKDGGSRTLYIYIYGIFFLVTGRGQKRFSRFIRIVRGVGTGARALFIYCFE